MLASLYEPTFHLGVTTLCLLKGFMLMGNSGDTLVRPEVKSGNSLFIWLIAITLGLWLGMRPPTYAFGDTGNYAVQYNLALLSRDIAAPAPFSFSGEWAFGLIRDFCIGRGLSASTFFTIIALGYNLFVAWAAKKYCPSSPYLAFLFFISALMFYPFCVNGMRNGLACHVMLLAIALILEERYAAGVILCVLAAGIHKSSMLPLGALLASMVVFKHSRWPFYIWLGSIAASLALGNSFAVFFAGLGFDDRMSDYVQTDQYSSTYGEARFRWDFLIYSAGPVVMWWYVAVKRGLRDGWYNILMSTYFLSNAFWVMIIRVAYSNRFAYLSWFLYPILIAYPLCNMKIWEDQDSQAGKILIVYAGFTYFMCTFVW